MFIPSQKSKGSALDGIGWYRAPNQSISIDLITAISSLPTLSILSSFSAFPRECPVSGQGKDCWVYGALILPAL